MSVQTYNTSARRRERRVTTRATWSLWVATLLVVALTACAEKSHDDPGPVDLARADSATTTLGAPATTTSGHGDTMRGERRRDPLPLVPPAGSVDFSWQRTELPTRAGTEAFIELVADTERGFAAFGNGFGQQPGTAGLLMWESVDGLAWTAVSDLTGVPAGFENGRVTPLAEGFVARGETYDGEDHEGRTLILYSSNGHEWRDVTPQIDLQDREHLYLHEEIVVGELGAITVGSIEYNPPEPPLEIRAGDYTLIVDHEDHELLIVDGDGVTRYTGAVDEIYGRDAETEEGIALFDPETGDPLVVLPWDVMEEVDSLFNDMDHGAEPEDLVLEFDGYAMTISGYEPGNPEGAEVEIRDVATGALVIAGSVPELTQGPPPRFVATDGTVLIDFPTWDAFWEAEHAAYEQFGDYFDDRSYSKPIALVSETGERWSAIDLGGGIASNQTAYLHQAFVGPDRFLIRGSVDNRDTHQYADVEWTSSDGISWDLAPAADAGDFVWGVVRTSSGLIGVAGEEQGVAVLVSDDGIEWEPALVVAGDEGTYSWVQSVAVGDLGAVVVVMTEGPYEGAEPHGDVHVDEFEYVTTTIASEVDVVTAAPATTVVSHSEDGHGDEEFGDVEFFDAGPPQSVLYVTFDGRSFYEIADDGSFADLWISNVQVVGDRVFVVAQEQLEEHGDTDGEERIASPLILLVGTLLD